MWHANVQECAEQEPEARRRPGKGRIQDGNFHQLFTRHWSVRHCLPLGLRCVIWIRPEACVECTTVPHVGHVCECTRLASRPLATRNCLPQPPPRRWSTHPVATVLCNDWAQYGQRYVYTRGVAVSGLRASCWGDEWATPVLVSSVPVDVCLASCIFWISLRTSARIASCRWLVSRCRKRAKRWFVRWARRHTRAKAVHALHTCVLFWVYVRLCCQAVNSARGLRSLHWEHCQQPRCLVVHSLQQRRSAWRAFHAAGPNSASGFATPHLKHGFFVSHVMHTRKKRPCWRRLLLQAWATSDLSATLTGHRPRSLWKMFTAGTRRVQTVNTLSQGSAAGGVAP